MIGAGVFLGIGNAVRVVGLDGVLLTFSLYTLLALFTAIRRTVSSLPRLRKLLDIADILNVAEVIFMVGMRHLVFFHLRFFSCPTVVDNPGKVQRG